MPTAPTTAIPWAPLPGDGYPPEGDDWREWYGKYQENIERYEMQLFDLNQLTERAKKVAKLREAEVKRQRNELFKLQEENKKLEDKVQEGVSVCEGAKESMEEMFKRIKELEAQENEEDFEEKAIQYVYEHTDQYDDWVKGSNRYRELEALTTLLTEENKELKENLKLSEDKVCELTHENMEYSGIQEENKKLQEVLKFYWSDGLLGCDHNIIPDEWQDELKKAQKDE